MIYQLTEYVVNKPPTITCPSVVGPFYPDKGMDTVVVTWDVPTATDPEGKLDRFVKYLLNMSTL